jgi:hypothetical protein
MKHLTAKVPKGETVYIAFSGGVATNHAYSSSILLGGSNFGCNHFHIVI